MISEKNTSKINYLRRKQTSSFIETAAQASNTILIDKTKQGDAHSFSIIYDKYSDSLYGLILKIVKQDDLAQDILQECFLKIWDKIDTYNPEKGTLFTWMLNICRNKSIDSLRKTQRQQKSTDALKNSTSFSDSFEMNPETIGLRDVLSNLSDEKRIIIEYLYFKGYTQKETSEELEIPLGTVKTRSRMAILELKEYFTLILASWIANNI